MEILDNFAVFEGGDGSGTSTQLAILKQKFHDSDRKSPLFHSTEEPTDGVIGQLIRSALKKDIILKPETLARLFAADRHEHLFAEGGIVDRCHHGDLVICDRFTLSSLIYQGIVCGEALPRSLNAAFPYPQMLLFFDIDPEAAQERMAKRASIEIFDHLEFQKKVRQRYHAILGEYRDSGVMVTIIDASQSVEKVAEDVWNTVSKMPIMN